MIPLGSTKATDIHGTPIFPGKAAHQMALQYIPLTGLPTQLAAEERFYIHHHRHITTGDHVFPVKVGAAQQIPQEDHPTGPVEIPLKSGFVGDAMGNNALGVAPIPDLQ